MTCNQLMLLLAIYRGTLELQPRLGTHHDDLVYLRVRKLIAPSTYLFVGSGKATPWQVTERGSELVGRCLTMRAVEVV